MRDRFFRILNQLSVGIYEKEAALALGLLALVAGESLFLLGPPGVAKSLIARRLKAAFDKARAFEYLMGRFSTPEEIFGPLSIAGLRDKDLFERKTDGYLPQADIGFLDEIWRASPPIQNTLLTILNEKVFRNGGREENVPLKLLIGASNRVPENEENVEAFWDRFVLRLEVVPLKEPAHFQSLLTGTSDVYHPEVASEDRIREKEWPGFQEAIDRVVLPEEVLNAFEALRVALREPGLYVSDRRWKKAARLVKASAFVHGRETADSLDLGLLANILWHRLDQREDLENLLVETLERHGWRSQHDPGSLHRAVNELKASLKDLTLVQRVVTVPKPVIFDGEYHVLLGYPGDLSARIWAQDFLLLQPDEELEGEIFFFKPFGAFVHSEKHHLRKGDGTAEAVVDGRLYALESRPEEKMLWDRIVPEGAALRSWEKKADQLMDTILETRRAMQEEVEGRSRSALGHFFVVEPYLSACRKSFDVSTDALGDLLVRLEQLMETRDAED